MVDAIINNNHLNDQTSPNRVTLRQQAANGIGLAAPGYRMDIFSGCISPKERPTFRYATAWTRTSIARYSPTSCVPTGVSAAPPPLRPPIAALTASSPRALLIPSITSRAPGYDKPVKRPAPLIDPCD